MKPHFSGYASKADLLCSDGRTIKPHAFKGDHGKEVPIYLEHRKTGLKTELGRAVLEDREDGTYSYGYFNDTPEGQIMKKAVSKGKFNGLSVRAVDLVHKGADVVKGVIEELSLVIKGANPGASIQNVAIEHSSGYMTEADDEAIIFTGLTLEHSDIPEDLKEYFKDILSLDHSDSEGDDVADGDDKGKSVADVLKTLNEEQRLAVGHVVEEALFTEPPGDDDKDDDAVEHSDSDDVEEELDLSDENSDEDDSDDDDNSDDEDSDEDDSDDENEDTLNHSHKENKMGKTRNAFEDDAKGEVTKSNTLSHSDISDILADARKNGSFKDAFLNFIEHSATYGFEDIDILFPDAKTIQSRPELISRRMEWVSKVINGVRHSPFTRIKSIVADITAEEARAKGYVKGNLKKEEIVKLLKRKTGPTTIYKKQKLDRDDILDITDLDVVAWLKEEMRVMLDEEIARAILVGDGRNFASEDKIDEDSIRPIASDDEMYSIHITLPSNVTVEARMEAMIRARSEYRGSGNPTLYTTLSFVTDMLLLRDKMGRRLYRNLDEVASELLAKEIVTVEVMEEYPTIAGIYVNLSDYTVGTDKGGNVSFFDDFDIDYNQHKYLLETRISGALTKPKSAITIHLEEGTAATPVSPSFDGETNTITIPTTTGIDYQIAGVTVTGTRVITEDTEVTAVAKEDYYIPSGKVRNWTFVYTDEG